MIKMKVNKKNHQFEKFFLLNMLVISLLNWLLDP